MQNRFHDGTEKLGRFGHHPDPAIDFCVEVDYLKGMQYDVGCRRASEAEFNDRVARAMEFRVGGDQHAIAAKAVLREMAN